MCGYFIKIKNNKIDGMERVSLNVSSQVDAGDGVYNACSYTLEDRILTSALKTIKFYNI